ncbi:MAG TPA: universal stress protein [Planctomycetota bacterium]|nr:universal stress protein [Planctomycetota bacterium]
MLKFREILVPTDLSKESTAAFAIARDLAEASGAKLVLVTVADDSARLRVAPLDSPAEMLNMDFNVVASDLLRLAEERLQSLAPQLAPGGVETLVVEGYSPAREIVKVAKERKSDLIVIATHGRTGLAHTLIGSTTEKVVRGAPCPVLAVPCRS